MVIDDNRLSSRVPKNYDFLPQHSKAVHCMAHPLDRLAAFAVDCAILFIFCSLAIAPFQKKIKAAQLVNENEQVLVGIILAFLAVGLIAVLYQSVFSVWKGGTIGKLAFGIRIVDVWTGQRPTWSDGLLRAFIWCIDTVLICLPHFGIYSDPLRRPFHDRLANTVVVSVSNRKGLAPESIEISVVKSAFVLFYCFAFLLIAQQIRSSYRLLNADENANILSLASPDYCTAVSQAQSQWPLENNESATRISIALALFAAGQIEEDCLDQEAYLEFQNGDRFELAYMARAFSTSNESALSDKYLEQVCVQAQNSEACQLGNLISYWTNRSWDKATEGFMTTLPTASVFVKTWAIKHFEKVKDYSQELSIINSLWPMQGLNEFLASHRTVALWGIHRKKESLISMKSAIEILPKSKQLGLSGWVCFNELETGCVHPLPDSCQHFEKLSDDYSSAFSHDLYALTQVRISACEGYENMQSLKGLIEEPRVAKIMEALEAEQEGQVSEAMSIYRDVAENTEGSSPIYHDAVKRFLKIAKTEDRDQFLSMVLEDWSQTKTADLWNWYLFGENLMESLIESGRFAQATSIGTQILIKDPYNTSVKKQMVIASFKNKDYKKTAQYLKLLDSEYVEARSPASEDLIKSIRRTVLRENK